MKIKIILIAGPTASGKSKLAIKLAKFFNGEIINADSMQIYKEISILTSKPNTQDIKTVKHNLYGFCSVKNNFSTGHWLKLLTKKIDKLWKKKRIPIIVEKYEGCELPEIDKLKYLVPKDMTMPQFIFVIRKRIKLTPSQTLFVMVNNTLVGSSKLISEIYDELKDKDGFLYVTYTNENTFG